MEYKGKCEECDEWPQEFRALLKLLNCLFPHVKVDRVLALGSGEELISTTEDLIQIYNAAADTGLIRLRLLGEEYCCQNLGACLPPPGFCRTRVTPPQQREPSGLQCFKCAGSGRRCLKDCKECRATGCIDVALVPKYAALNTFVKREVARLSLAAFADTRPCESEVHTGIRCVLCGTRPIVGVRYLCSVCEDFNVCSLCEGKTPHPHPYVKMRQDPSKAKPVKNRQCDPESRLCCRFVKDVVGKEGEVHLTAAQFTKSWRVRNTGHTAWPRGCRMIFVNGDFDGPPAPMQPLQPGGECDVTVTCTAPAKEGEYYSLWRACDPAGMRFGHRLSIKIRVVARGDQPADTRELLRALEQRPEDIVQALRAAEGDISAALALLSASDLQS